MKIIKFKPTYVRSDGLSVIYAKSIPFPDNFKSNIKESGVVEFPPNSVGGKHKHPRIECLYSLGNLVVFWKSKKGIIKSESMSPENGFIKLYVTEPNEAHKVINNSNTLQILIEYASESQHDVKDVTI